MFLAFGPLLLDFLVWVSSHLRPVFGGFLHLVETTFANQLNAMIFLFSTLLNRLNVFESLYRLLCLLVPPLHFFACHKCHESILLELDYVLG